MIDVAPVSTETPTETPTELPTETPIPVSTVEPMDEPTVELAEAATEPTATAAPSPTATSDDAPAPTIAIVGDIARGEAIFSSGRNGAPPCSTCHLVRENQTGFSLGPNLAGVSTRAATRVEGEDADAYLHESILEPKAHIVPGYRDMMYPAYGDHLSEQDLEDLIAYLKSL